MKQVLVTADLNTTYVQANKEAWVDLTPQVKALIDVGTLYDITPPPPRKPRAKKVDDE